MRECGRVRDLRAAWLLLVLLRLTVRRLWLTVRRLLLTVGRWLVPAALALARLVRALRVLRHGWTIDAVAIADKGMGQPIGRKSARLGSYRITLGLDTVGKVTLTEGEEVAITVAAGDYTVRATSCPRSTTDAARSGRTLAPSDDTAKGAMPAG
ncbi:hypothetical protein Atai01_45490 [Amycolatopsis taiwanensis]|uniref:Uncharacterized protein n=1 Tax=Amycolatopsis taiwanensis TaxID=342230 RepID=A0A9W6R5N5_9PSEU|nr:hypothetical protein Atai01_45490 [Amycolatopsis taiwanensis]